MKFDLKLAVAASALALCTAQASAATPIGDYLTFSGFGTLGWTQTDDDATPYIHDGQTKGATKQGSFNVDSNIGLQLTARPTKWLSATVQMLGQQRTDANISTEVEWAFVKVEPIQGLSIRGGRMALPMFAISDTRNVGYANNWVRAPNEVYGMALLHRMQGADATYRLPLGSTSLSLSVLAGKSSVIGRGNAPQPVENLKGVNAQWESDWVTLRVGRVKGEVTVDDGINNGTDTYTFTGFGAIVDHNNIVAQAEYVTRRSELLPAGIDANGWYLLGGYRLGSVLPYVSYADTKPVNVNAFYISNKQSTFAAGLRWDAFRSAALKFQLERTDTHGTSGISFVVPTVLNPFGPPTVGSVTGPVTVASLSVDFVF
jgi:hypothetical protein